MKKNTNGGAPRKGVTLEKESWAPGEDRGRDHLCVDRPSRPGRSHLGAQGHEGPVSSE